eukprot:scaffold159592_cov32-Tisochrysis_lutea.AAC.3
MYNRCPSLGLSDVDRRATLSGDPVGDLRPGATILLLRANFSSNVSRAFLDCVSDIKSLRMPYAQSMSLRHLMWTLNVDSQGDDEIVNGCHSVFDTSGH